MRKTIKTLDDFIETMSDTIREIKKERDQLVEEMDSGKSPCEEIKDDIKEFKNEFVNLYDYSDAFIELGDISKANRLMEQLKDLELKINQIEDKLN